MGSDARGKRERTEVEEEGVVAMSCLCISHQYGHAKKKYIVVIYLYCAAKFVCSEDLERINPGNFMILDIRYDDLLANHKMFDFKSV